MQCDYCNLDTVIRDSNWRLGFSKLQRSLLPIDSEQLSQHWPMGVQRLLKPEFRFTPEFRDFNRRMGIPKLFSTDYDSPTHRPYSNRRLDLQWV
jgi:hypothetical protein